jgi:hypothetical protein
MVTFIPLLSDTKQQKFKSLCGTLIPYIHTIFGVTQVIQHVVHALGRCGNVPGQMLGENTTDSHQSFYQFFAFFFAGSRPMYKLNA